MLYSGKLVFLRNQLTDDSALSIHTAEKSG